MIFPTGLKLESYKFTDHSHERIFGTASLPVAYVPLDRDTTGIPVVYQGRFNTCVACTIVYQKQWEEKTGVRLSWPFLAQIAQIGQDGASPSQVLEPARKEGITTWDTFQNDLKDQFFLEAANHKINDYSFVTDYSKKGIYTALTRSPLAIGVRNWKGIGDHMMWAYDVTPDGSALRAKSWWNENVQTEEIVQFDQVEVAISFAQDPNKTCLTIPFYTVLIDKIISLFKYVH